MIKFLQINVGVRRAAQDLTLGLARRWDVDVLIISEQHRSLQETDGWFADTSNRSAVVVLSGVPVNHVGPQENGFRWIEIPGLRIYSCYWSPNCTIAEYTDFLLRLEMSIRNSSIPVLVAGDFNAKSGEWGSLRDDARGLLLADMIAALDLLVCNNGNSPTFVRGDSESIIDITITTRSMHSSVVNWKVLDDESLSLHRFIQYGVGSDNQQAQPPQAGWSMGRFDSHLLAVALAVTPRRGNSSQISADEDADSLVEWIRRATALCTTGRPGKVRKPPVHWWNKRIEDLRRDCLKARRLFQRRRGRNGEAGAAQLEERWKALRKSLATEIKAAKEKCWGELIAMVDGDVWGKPYKVVTQRLKGYRKTPGLELPGRKESIIAELFPHAAGTLTRRYQQLENDSVPFTGEEVLACVSTFSNRKAPGPDGMPNEVVKAAAFSNPDQFCNLFNKCLEKGSFPRRWKNGKLVLIAKPGKPLDNPNAYRPICLLDGCGKLLEKLIVSRLRNSLVGEQDIASCQYGFRKGRSTLDALMQLKAYVHSATTGHAHHHRLVGILTLDVRNAFNSAPRDHILAAFEDRNIPNGISRLCEAYLSHRRITVEGTAGGSGFSREVNCGVPQGSVLGPDLWNLFYDDLLRTPMPHGVALIAFADDVAVISTALVPVLLEESLEEAFNLINGWMEGHGLQLAAEKTEALVITKRRVHNEIAVNCAGHRISSSQSLRYLGVQLDKKFGFWEHACITAVGAEKMARQLGCLMPNLGGPRQKSRRLLTSVTTSKLLYAAPFWSPSMEKRGWKKIAEVHRRSQLRTACCFRTVSYAAAAVVSGIPPIRLLAKERSAIYSGCEKKTARSNLFSEWQREWEVAREGRWTHRLIRDLNRWCGRNFGEVSFHLTQVLTGHGCFAAYLKRFGIQESDSCAQCGTSPDDPEHAIFQCDAWENWRRSTCAQLDIETLSPDNVISTMLKSAVNWTAISKLLQRIMSTREAEERERQRISANVQG